jgi:NAD(P)-dependent dehydrogenase (short-subunit alcohol dehydrogenase family)
MKDQRVAIITGASRGIGLAAALELARDGYAIVAAARNAEKLEAAVKQMRDAGAAATGVSVDMARPDDARRLVDAAAKEYGRIDVLVNNAGAAPLVPIAEMNPADFDQVTAINMAAIFHATRAVWPLMQQQGGGVIVNISSMAALDPFAGFAAYGASKAWVNVFTKAAAAEGKPHGIRVYAVAPGAVETELMRSVFPDFPADKTLAPDDVAGVIASVVSSRMAAASGETIFVRK